MLFAKQVHGADSVMVADTLYNIAFVYRTKQRATKSKQASTHAR